MDEKQECEQKCPEGKVWKDGKCVLPEVTFTTLIMSFNTSALYHLGEIEDPVSGGRNKDLMLAKHTIDTLALLQKKTAGNLSAEESELIENILYDLKLRYVKAKE